MGEKSEIEKLNETLAEMLDCLRRIEGFTQQTAGVADFFRKRAEKADARPVDPFRPPNLVRGRNAKGETTFVRADED